VRKKKVVGVAVFVNSYRYLHLSTPASSSNQDHFLILFFILIISKVYITF